MDFNLPYFLFFFLPILLIIYYLADPRFRNIILLIASLLFYSSSDLRSLPLILLLIIINFELGKLISNSRRDSSPAKGWLLSLAIVLNLLPLVVYKFFTSNFFGPLILNLKIPLLDSTINTLGLSTFPLGLSFITFQLLAYILDVKNGKIPSEDNVIRFSIYVFLFPKIIIGPITRYGDIVKQINSRVLDSNAIVVGIRRFIIGFAKKVLIADTLAQVVNPIFALDKPNLSTGLLWFSLIAYALQIYYDFSGYTDMALGLAKMLGFTFPENFNEPYAANSLADFWRRWHISLSRWFRDYLFIPLDYKFRRMKSIRKQLIILVVFLLTGLWHGFNPNFAIWGILHGAALGLEMTTFGRWLKKSPAIIQHGYALSIILAGWVFFRSPTIIFALQYFRGLLGLQGIPVDHPYNLTRPIPIINTSVWIVLILGLFFVLPVKTWLANFALRIPRLHVITKPGFSFLMDIALLALFVFSIAALTNLTYSGNLYKGF